MRKSFQISDREIERLPRMALVHLISKRLLESLDSNYQVSDFMKHASYGGGFIFDIFLDTREKPKSGGLINEY